jgi:superoxide dismutase, Cu-Zn family
MPRPLLLAAALSLATATGSLAQDGAVSALLKTADGADAGKVRFQEMRAGVLVVAELTGLPQGEHGLHIHAIGACEPDFSAAGDHLAPDDHEHGFATTDTPHAGDLPNIVVNADGDASAQFLNWRLTFDDLLDADGAAIVVHERADTYMDPASAGERIACGVIDRQS